MYAFADLLLLSFLTVTTISTAQATRPGGNSYSTPSKIRTVVTTDMEQDDLASMVRYLLYTPDVETQGIIYSSSRYHWEGDYAGTEFFLPGREYTTPQTSFRWTGNTTIQDTVIPAYARVFSNLRRHDSRYPTPDELLSLVKIGNVDFEGAFANDTDGSNLIKALMLDDDPRPLFLQAWGGTNTIARALKSIEEQFSGSEDWSSLKCKISEKMIILASGFQDNTYAEYIAPTWPTLQVRSSGVAWTTLNCAKNGTTTPRGWPDDTVYFSGAWTRKNIEIGPYGRLYRSWLDGQHMSGDRLDVFGNTTAAPITPEDWCQPLAPYTFLGEGDDGTYLPLLATGLQDPSDPNLGGWGGRSERNRSSVANLWQSVLLERGANGTVFVGAGTNRFISAAQNDFAARIQWTLTANYSEANHPPSVAIQGPSSMKARPGTNVTLTGLVSDPDHDTIVTEWWQYLEEGTYNGTVAVTPLQHDQALVSIPVDALEGQSLSIILQATDDRHFPLTRYNRIMIEVCGA